MHEIDYRYLRPKKAEAHRRWQEAPMEVRDDLQVWRGQNAVILPLRREPQSGLLFGKGGVVDQSGNYLDLSCIPNRVQFAYPFSDPQYKNEKAVYCGYLVNQWGHFLVEAVTRLWYFLEGDETVEKYVFFVDEKEDRLPRGNYREFLELLGVWEKIEIINQPTAYRELIVPEVSCQSRVFYSNKYRDIFDRVAENVTVDPSWTPLSKIYYSRSQLAKGRPFEFGFETLDDFFSRNGYTLLYPEKVPLSQMIYYIRNSQVVASLSGSLPHNMLFARQGQRVEILERCVINDDNQTDVNRIRELKVTPIDANISLYTIDFVGPFIMGYNQHLQRFAEDNGYLPPDPKYCSEKHYRKCFIQYMKAYEDLYGYRWFMMDWYTPFADYLWEAYQEGLTYFGPYLNRKRPFRWHHYFEVHYFKQFVKRILVKLNLRKEG